MREELRNLARKTRDKIIPVNKGAALRENFLKNIDLPVDAIIGAYWPIGSEIDVKPLITALYDKGHKIALPCIVAEHQPLNFREWEPNAVMVKSKFKIYEPCPQNHEELVPNVIMVPLLAFDAERHRLGYGGGYYDRTIEFLRSSAAQQLTGHLASPSRYALGNDSARQKQNAADASAAQQNASQEASEPSAPQSGSPSEGQQPRTGANNKILAIGIAYGEQQIEKIPNEDWDAQLDMVVTENSVYR